MSIEQLKDQIEECRAMIANNTTELEKIDFDTTDKFAYLIEIFKECYRKGNLEPLGQL